MDETYFIFEEKYAYFNSIFGLNVRNKCDILDGGPEEKGHFQGKDICLPVVKYTSIGIMRYGYSVPAGDYL